MYCSSKYTGGWSDLSFLEREIFWVKAGGGVNDTYDIYGYYGESLWDSPQ